MTETAMTESDRRLLWRPYRLRSQPWWDDPTPHVGTLEVDLELEDDVLDQLNAIPGLLCVGTCAGHPWPRSSPFRALFGVTLAIDHYYFSPRRRRDVWRLTERAFARLIRQHQLPLVDLRVTKPWDANPPTWWAESPRLDDPVERMRWFATAVERLASAVAHHAAGQLDLFCRPSRRRRVTA